jgi:hypothetical protein
VTRLWHKLDIGGAIGLSRRLQGAGARRRAFFSGTRLSI